MKTKQFDDKVRQLVFNPQLLPKSEGYKKGDKTFTAFGYNLLSLNTYKVFSLLLQIDEIMDDPKESIGWLCRQLNIYTDLCEMDIEPEEDFFENVDDYLESDKDEESGLFWLFEDQKEIDKFLDSCSLVKKYSDILLIGKAFEFDIIYNAEFFAHTIFGEPLFYIRYDKDIEDITLSRYYISVYAGIIYFWAWGNNLITNRIQIRNENKDNLK